MRSMPAAVMSLLAAAGTSIARAAAAADAAPPPPAGMTGGLLQALLGLGVVLALIWGAAWLMRRLQPAMGTHGGTLKVVATQSVGQRERVVVLEINEQWLVVGVAPGSVNALATLPKGTAAPATPVPNAFAGLLARARGERSA